MAFRRVHFLGVLGAIVVIGVLITLPARAQSAQIQSVAATARLDSVMNALMALKLAPGAGIVVVRDTQIVYMKGFGYADLAARKAITPETGFYIASATKSFTGLAAALLDRKGVFKLDAPLSRYLPAAKLKAPLNADSIPIRSLLTHTHGIGNNGPVVMRLAYTGEYGGNAELIKFLGQHDAAKSGRAWSYGNIGYNVAALAMDAVTRKSWKDVLQLELFTPLGMKKTTAYVSRLSRDELATPYSLNDDGWTARPYGKVDANMQSAGGLITTLRDMGTWLEVNINKGRVDGRQVLPSSAFVEAHANHAPAQRNTQAGKQVGYGFGWNIMVNGNDTILIHGGGYPGFATHMSFSPRRNIGVAVFANNDEMGTGLVGVAGAMVYDVMTDGAIKGPPMGEMVRMATQARDRMTGDIKRRSERPQQLPFPLAAYTGLFEDPVLGRLRLALVNGKLEARVGAAWSAVEVFDNVKNELRINLFGDGEVFAVEMKDGKAVALRVAEREFRRVNK